jgi:steroid delta-isomerase-like uncharacterized protein
MSTEENRAIGHQCVDAMNAHDLEAVMRFMRPDFVSHFPGAPAPIEGIDAWKQLFGAYRSAFPDLRIDVVDELAEGDLGAARYTMSGTHLGEFNGIPPTGKRVSVEGIGIFRMVEGRIAEEWQQPNLLGLMQQLGVVPAAV